MSDRMLFDFTPFDGRHDQVVTARLAPQPEPVAQRLDRQRSNKTPSVVLGECVPSHRGMMDWSALQRKRTSTNRTGAGFAAARQCQLHHQKRPGTQGQLRAKSGHWWLLTNQFNH